MDFVVLLFLNTFQYGKCLETGEMTTYLEYGKCLETGETTKFFEYGMCLYTGETTKSFECGKWCLKVAGKRKMTKSFNEVKKSGLTRGTTHLLDV